MAVRFLPPPEERKPALRDESENLAEVVEMRSWLRAAPADWGDSEAGHLEAEEPVADGPEADCVGKEDPEVAPSVRFSMLPSGTPAGSMSSPLEELIEERGPVYDDGVRLLARRARSSGELRSELLALDHPYDEVSIIIDEFVESHYLDDLGLARTQSEKLRDSKGASRGQIQRKLRERKLPDDVIEEVLGELDVDEEYSLLREAATKRAEKLTGLDRQTAQRRLLGFLARRGWSGEPASRAVREALDGAGAAGSGRYTRSVRGTSGVKFE